MDMRDIIPLEAIKDTGGLLVPFVLSRQAAGRLEASGWANLEFAGTSPKGQSNYYLARLTDKGRSALARARKATP